MKIGTLLFSVLAITLMLGIASGNAVAQNLVTTASISSPTIPMRTYRWCSGCNRAFHQRWRHRREPVGVHLCV